jgi:hypothetical protein
MSVMSDRNIYEEHAYLESLAWQRAVELRIQYPDGAPYPDAILESPKPSLLRCGIQRSS